MLNGVTVVVGSTESFTSHGILATLIQDFFCGRFLNRQMLVNGAARSCMCAYWMGATRESRGG